MNYRQNIVRIKAVCNALEELADQVVFVGGATVALYADRSIDEVRPTDDIDILVELLNYHGYTEIEEKLRAKGFVNDTESRVICRYKIHGIIVDVMPTSTDVLGFANRWYPEGFSSAIEKAIEEELTVKIFRPEYFIATKLEAYNNRGEADGRLSADFEDIIFVLNKRDQIWDELSGASLVLKEYLQNSFKKLIEEKYIYEWISVHLDHHEQKRVGFIIGGLQDFVGKQRKADNKNEY